MIASRCKPSARIFALQPRSPDVGRHQNHPEALLQHRSLSRTPRVSDSTGLGMGPENRHVSQASRWCWPLLFWDHTRGITAPNLPRQSDPERLVQTPSNSFTPDTWDGTSSRETQESVFLIKSPKRFRASRPRLLQPEKQWLPFRSGPRVSNPRLPPSLGSLPTRGPFKVQEDRSPANASSNNLSGNWYIDC